MINKADHLQAYPAEIFKRQLRQDLVTAMRGRQAMLAATLRTLIAAIDNREAPALCHVPADAQPTGPAGTASEIARLRLSRRDIVGILRAEVSEREQAAAGMERFGRPSDAERLRAGIAVVTGYLEQLTKEKCSPGDVAAIAGRET